MTQSPQPRDAKVISLILQSLSVEDAEQKVIHQLLEFANRYTTDVFQDALLYSEHAGRTEVGLDDVKLAIQGRVNHSFTAPPPKELPPPGAQQDLLASSLSSGTKEAAATGAGSSEAPPSLFKVKDEHDSDEEMAEPPAQEEPLSQNQQNMANHELWKRKRADDEENYDDE
ncbi:Transcription initiation factor TFIID subunit 9 [Mortierella polycephala]|uniref:Transcription initiation factor TFIID subunit 9 n=1 Tax=Mortierella polycephala TaxID=41804 RepID=A0A9P6Q4V4_9FUNG|nr:Transcription initiation factor TFIID subunit 9 [Mortierella polycephala]